MDGAGEAGVEEEAEAEAEVEAEAEIEVVEQEELNRKERKSCTNGLLLWEVCQHKNVHKYKLYVNVHKYMLQSSLQQNLMTTSGTIYTIARSQCATLMPNSRRLFLCIF